MIAPVHWSEMKRCPVPPSVLDYAGDNTVGLSVWSQEAEEAKVNVRLEMEYAAASS
jgi:hypothetical protein